MQELCTYLPALDASELQAAVTAAVAPQLKGVDYKALRKSLQAQAKALYPRPQTVAPEVIRHDPEAAAAWFAEQGVLIEKPLTG